jgi:hypothetical protein
VEDVVHFTARLGRGKNTEECTVATTDECPGSYLEETCVNGICQCKNAIRDMCQTQFMIVADSRQTTFLMGPRENEDIAVERRVGYIGNIIILVEE